jgi:hypothetical protein
MVQACGEEFHHCADAVAKRHGASAQQSLDPTAPPGDAVDNHLRVLGIGRQHQAGGAANPPSHGDGISNRKKWCCFGRIPPCLNGLHDHPPTAHGSVDRGQESRVRNDVRRPGGDGLVTAAAHRGEHDKALLHSIGK